MGRQVKRSEVYSHYIDPVFAEGDCEQVKKRIGEYFESAKIGKPLNVPLRKVYGLSSYSLEAKMTVARKKRERSALAKTAMKMVVAIDKVMKHTHCQILAHRLSEIMCECLWLADNIETNPEECK